MKTRLPALFVTIALLVPTVAGAGGYRFDEDKPFEIIGEVQKPEVAVFISRQNLNKRYELVLKTPLLPKIIESVEHPPF